MSYEKWPLGDNHQSAVAKWENYPAVVRLLDSLYRMIHNRILSIANRRGPFNPKCQEESQW
jgi:hypothetical protein